MIIYKKYFFDAAHFLTDFKKNHKYSKVHGHSYEMTVRISGEINESNCWVIDFEDIDKIVKPVVEKLDHQTLNEIKGLENPTRPCLSDPTILRYITAMSRQGLTVV